MGGCETGTHQGEIPPANLPRKESKCAVTGEGSRWDGMGHPRVVRASGTNLEAGVVPVSGVTQSPKQLSSYCLSGLR